jgi:periplasmic copper chaperone A
MKCWLTLGLVLGALQAQACANLEVTQTWVREGPPGAAVLAGFGELRNGGRERLTITGFHSPQFKHVMLHETVFAHGEARMEARPKLRIAAHTARSLAPNGLHLMLMHPSAALQAGQSVIIEFACGDARARFSFPVRQAAPRPVP